MIIVTGIWRVLLVLAAVSLSSSRATSSSGILSSSSIGAVRCEMRAAASNEHNDDDEWNSSCPSRTATCLQ